MNEVKIVGKPISVKEWHGQRVVTFKDIDTVHGRVDGTARRNFNKNKNHFIEGEDWYKIQPNEIRTVGISSPNGGIVLTETGYLMLAKSFTDDLAWKVQRQLVNSYFRFKETKVKDKQLEFYNYFDKTYKGEPVLSIADVEYFTGLNRYSISKALKTGVEFMDYYYIDGENLMRFKNDNPKLSKLVSEMYIVTKSGFEMICKAYGIEIETPKLFIEDKKSNLPKRKVVILPSKAMQSLMGYVQRETKAIEGISHLMLTRDTKEHLNNYRKLLSKRIKDLSEYCLDIEIIKI